MDDRFRQLEEKSMFLEQQVEALDQVVRDVFAQLERQRREMAALRRMVEELQEGNEVEGPAD